MEQALKTYELEMGTFPNTSQGLAALVSKPSDVSDEMWDGPYLDADAVPKDGWGREFKYRYPPENHINFDLFSMGRDGVENTEDDIVNWTKEK
jgi:general secretion pathway protein G